ncbi:MAG: hypothetical protein AAB368_00290, partial [bacterium]
MSVAVTKTHSPASPAPSNPVTYALIVTNTSANQVLTSLTVADTLPSAVTFASQTNSGGLTFAQNGAVLSWTGAVSLAAGASVTVTVDGTNTCPSGSVVNQAWAVGSNGCISGEAASPDDTYASGSAVTLAVTQVRTPAPPRPGETVTYAFFVTNTS